MRAALAVVACLSLACASSAAQDASKSPSPAELSRQATERAKAVKLPPVKQQALNAEQRKRIEETAAGARNRARDELSRLAERQPFTPESAKVAAASSDNPAVPPKTERKLSGRVVVALSSSMPENELQEYMAQLNGNPEALVVMRGFVGGARTVMPTGKLMERVMRKKSAAPKDKYNRVEVVVDPLLYRSLGIDKVPAVVWLPGVTDISHCDGEDFEAAVTVYGTVSVGYALQQINRSGGNVPVDVLKSFGG